MLQSLGKKTQQFLLLRFLIATLAPTILLCLSISFGVLDLYKQYVVTQKKIEGTHAIHLLFRALTDLQKIRGLSRVSLWGHSSLMDVQLHDFKVEFENHFKGSQCQELGAEFCMQDEVAAIMPAVRNIFSANYDVSAAPAMFADYTILIEKIQGLILLVADRSSLILDPELDTYYLMEISVKQIPYLAESVAKIRGLGSGMIARQNITEKDKELLREKVSIVRDQINKLDHTKSIIREANPEIEMSFERGLSRYGEGISSFLQLCETLQDENKTDLSAEDFFERGTEVVDNLGEINYVNVALLESRLKQRQAQQKKRLMMTLLIAMSAIAVILSFSLSFYRRERQSYQELEQLSITDPLTSIPNRRYLDLVFHREMQRARRDGKGIAFGLLDIDFFKLFNDTYGHHQGDLALQQVAAALKSSLQRANDFYFRFGGEEFCFLMSANSRHEAEETVEGMRRAVQHLGIEHRRSTVLPVVTVSIGLLFLPEVAGQDLDFMIKEADDLLYQAKNQGRNRCIPKVTTVS